MNRNDKSALPQASLRLHRASNAYRSRNRRNFILAVASNLEHHG